ncbi:MAG: mechanosensitive ion channel family protein [Mangrovibacterium sp.]
MKKLIVICCLSLIAWHSFAQTDSLRSSVDSTYIHELRAMQEKLRLLEAQQRKIDELELQRENDSIQNSLLEAEVARLSGITNAADSDTVRLTSADIKRNLISSRMKVVIDLAQNAEYDEVGVPVIGAKNDTLFYLYAKNGGLTAAERAERTNKKIQQFYDADSFEENKLHLVELNGSYDVMYDQSTILNVSASDARVHGSTPKRMASDVEWLIRDSISAGRVGNNLIRWIIRILLACGVMVLSWQILRLVGKGYDRMLALADEKQKTWFRDLSYRNYTFMTAEQELKASQFLLRIISWTLYALFCYISLPILFSIFPFSRGWADVLFHLIWSPFKSIFSSIWNYLPNIFSILAIYFSMRYFIKFVRYIFVEIETEKLKINGFHADWAMTTYQIVRFVLYAFMFVLIFPLLPNSESGIFKGVSMFLGLLVSLGSSSAISNMVSGLVITYMRPFMIGDRIKINDVAGDVIEKTLLVTRIKTVKNEIITIPNSSVLTGNTTNYTFEAREKGLIVHSSVTIGYDVPWKDMHRALIDAALKTEHIMHEPLPFVLQTSLEDFYVSYQINAYTHEASKQALIYSNLHANIQDICNERGIEILSPHYRAARDGSESTIPKSYREE